MKLSLWSKSYFDGNLSKTWHTYIYIFLNRKYHFLDASFTGCSLWILLVITITFEGSIKLTSALCPCIRWPHIKWRRMRWLQTAILPGPQVCLIFLYFLLSALPALTLFPVCFLIFHLVGLLRISGWLHTISRVNCKGYPPTTAPWVFYLQCLFWFFLKLTSQFQMVEVAGHHIIW